MGDDTKLLLESMRGVEGPAGDEPVCYDVKSLLEATRNRVYTAEGRELVESARRENGAENKKPN